MFFVEYLTLRSEPIKWKLFDSDLQAACTFKTINMESTFLLCVKI